MYIDDVDVSTTISTLIDDTLDFSGQWHIFQNGSDGWTGSTADVWIDDTYIDISVEANRRKFINASGNPVYLGADGSLPTGSAPDIFLSGNTEAWHINRGTGGGFFEVGELTTAASTPYTPGLDDPCNPVNSPAPGQACFDGSVYAGISNDPDGAVELYVQRCDHGMTWDGSTCTGSRVLVPFGNGTTNYTLLGFSDFNNGDGYTATLQSLEGGADPNQPYQAAKVCYDLSESGHSDWYLPSTTDLNLMASNAVSIGNFAAGGPGNGSMYHSTRENSVGHTSIRAMLSANTGNMPKNIVTNVRCVRQGFVPKDCYNPPANSGEVIYNSSEDVFQGCTASGWIALHVVGTGGGGCANPTGQTGEIIYNSSEDVYQGCTVNGWMALHQ